MITEIFFKLKCCSELCSFVNTALFKFYLQIFLSINSPSCGNRIHSSLYVCNHRSVWHMSYTTCMISFCEGSWLMTHCLFSKKIRHNEISKSWLRPGTRQYFGTPANLQYYSCSHVHVRWMQTPLYVTYMCKYHIILWERHGWLTKYFQKECFILFHLNSLPPVYV